MLTKKLTWSNLPSSFCSSNKILFNQEYILLSIGQYTVQFIVDEIKVFNH